MCLNMLTTLFAVCNNLGSILKVYTIAGWQKYIRSWIQGETAKQWSYGDAQVVTVCQEYPLYFFECLECCADYRVSLKILGDKKFTRINCRYENPKRLLVAVLNLWTGSDMLFTVDGLLSARGLGFQR